MFGSWVPRIPTVKAALHLSAGQLGVALSAPALGAMIAMVGTGALIATHGSRSAVRAAMLAFAIPPAAIGLTRTLPELFAVLLLWGAGIGSLDVALNAQAVSLQDAFGRPIISTFHGMYSIGGLAGGGLGALAAAGRVPVTLDLGVTALLVLLIGEWATAGMLGDPARRRTSFRRFTRPDRQIALLAALGFAVLFCEGAASDWSAVYLRVTLGASAGVAGLGYVAFSIAMIGGRLTGDRLTKIFGGQRLCRWACLLAAAGCGAGLAVGTTASVIIAFGLLGAGVACGAPLVFSAAGQHEDPGPSVASVTTGSYVGFLVGPPIVGAVATVVSLRWALAVVPAAAFMAALMARASVLGSPSPSTMI